MRVVGPLGGACALPDFGACTIKHSAYFTDGRPAAGVAGGRVTEIGTLIAIALLLPAGIGLELMGKAVGCLNDPGFDRIGNAITVRVRVEMINRAVTIRIATG